TGWSEWEGELRPRAFDFNLVEKASHITPWAVPHLLHNANCKVRVWRMDEKMDFLVRNADGDELLFIHQGTADLYCDYGHLKV
ncbi:homogentisate 1,2-dioxygenase, partial [Vibrio parahaemolyticus]|nr:homogentisate 1,2-dioxygenase [Vibrio parahaemolyticus]